ncbi:hypothetical protein AAG570_004128 [Ranatra chinensis]|uniref:Importin N-terminal domain-containing protein n=1 Tax=Ranatra chinensis TaxID=642074 RepID=A0ABD0YFF7_9HEMI
MDAIHSLVLETLQRATSQNSDVLKPAEMKLHQWETESGFYTILKNIFCNHSIDNNVRLLAVLYLKNGVDRYWRRSAPNAISEHEKTVIREGLLSNFNEPVNHIAVQTAVLTAKIARYDCPHEWGTLVPTLLAGLKSGDPLVQHRATLSLHHVVKSLASRRLAGDRRVFQELAVTVFTFVYSVWETHTQLFFVKVQENFEEAIKFIEKALLSLKILEKLVVHGFKKPHESQDACLFLKVIFERAKAMLEIRTSLKGVLHELVEKYTIRLTNVLLSVLECHPFSFVDYVRPSLEFAVFYAFTPNGERYLFERFLIQCFNLIKALLLCVEYRPMKILEETKVPETLSAHQIKQAFFDTATLTAICRKIITHYFLLTPQDLQLWESDPETFAMDEGGESWKYTLRPSTELLFVTIFHEYRSTLVPVLVELIRNNHGLVDPSDFQAILAKDAVYNAIGLAAFDMYDEVDFDNWFKTTLRAELGVQGGNYRILRRRVAWLLGKWTGVKLSSELHPLLYSSMMVLLEPSEDMVVRLTAANTIRTVVDDFEFSTETFLEYLEPMFRLLFTLLKEAQECDTKMRVLNVLYFIVERVGISIEPYYHSLIQYLPLLWNESQNHNMLRCAVVATLVHLVKALGSVNDTEEASNFVLSVISLSTDVKQESHVYLLEDGLELWQAVIESTPQPTPSIMQLFSNMPPLLENNSEHLRLCVYIIQAYVVLSPDEFLQVYGQAIVNLCADLLTDLLSEGVVMILSLLELFIKANPTLSVNLLKPLLPKIFEVIYKGDELPMVMSVYLSILARVLLASKEIFIQTTNKLSEIVNQTPDSVISTILDVWLAKMPHVTNMERRKLLGLALSSLLIAQSSKFCGILLAVSEILNDITRVDDMGIRTDSLMFTGQDLSPPSQCYDSRYESEHEHRRILLAMTDPVHAIVMEEFFRSQMDQLKRTVGPTQFEQFVQTVDVETLAQIREYVQI